MIVGITETYDPCFVKDFESMLTQPVNIVITKELTDKLIDICIRNKEKIILHHTVTGHGKHQSNQTLNLLNMNLASLRNLLV